jgi:predicted Zn-ribbon and HTH transcriptional regulator
MVTPAPDSSPRVALTEPQRCPTCRTKIVVPDGEGILVKNAILRVSVDTGHASAKCPRCKSWVEVPLQFRK